MSLGCYSIIPLLIISSLRWQVGGRKWLLVSKIFCRECLFLLSEGVVTAYINQTAWNLVQISSTNRGSTLIQHIYTKSAICQVKMAEICQKSGRWCENLPLKASLWPHRSSLMHQIWSKWCSDKCQQLLLQTFWHQGPFSWQELGI